MKYLLVFCILINFIALIIFSTGSFMILKKELLPKKRAKITSIMAIFFFLYCFLLLILGTLGSIFENLKYLIFILFALIPFVFGYFVKYNTIKKYTIYHILCMVLSLILLIFIY